MTCFFLSRDGKVWVETLTQSTWASEPSVCWPPRLWFPPVHMKPAVSHRTTRTHTCMIPICPAAEEAALIHSTCDCNLYLRHILLPKQEISLRFVFWPILFFITALYHLHSQDNKGEKLKCEPMEVVKKMNCAIFTSQALGWLCSW